MVDRSEAADTWWGDKDYPPSIVLGIGKDVPSSIFGVTSGLAFAIGVYCVAQAALDSPHLSRSLSAFQPPSPPAVEPRQHPLRLHRQRLLRRWRASVSPAPLALLFTAPPLPSNPFALLTPLPFPSRRPPRPLLVGPARCRLDPEAEWQVSAIVARAQGERQGTKAAASRRGERAEGGVWAAG